ncbi:MAG: SAP domain-containing protein, partial [Candidatus Thermoplasmatota archaeon]|nr:SAP domain-containing protein [Candidatus Thermoplasmatota archaeon]
MSQSDYNNMLVAELKQELENFGLPTSGKKSELIERLMAHSKEPLMISIEADLIEDDSRYEAIFAKMKTQIVGPLNLGAIIAIGLSLLMISSVLILKPAWLGFGDDYDYQLIDFDQSQTKIYAEELVALGHPDWEGRMSGTVEEANTSLYILDRLSEMGYEAQSYSYEVPMHHVNSEPSFRLCVQGSLGFSPCDGPVGQVGGSQVTIFQHRVDYVIQGLSGQS